MGWVVPTSAGTFRASWRDPSGKERSKTFKIKRDARQFLARVEAEIARGTYVDPAAGKRPFCEFAERWMSSRTVQDSTDERAQSVMRAHVLPKWGAWPLSKIDHGSIQDWVNALGEARKPATVAKCYGMLSQILRAAVKARLIPFDPSEGVNKPSTYDPHTELHTVSRETFTRTLLPAIPAEPAHLRILVCLAAGAGLRWGEAAGLPWSAVDLDRGELTVRQVAVETARAVRIRQFPKTRHGIRTVPLADFLWQALTEYRGDPSGQPTCALVCPTSNGTPLRRSNFRRQTWRPALVRAGMLGSVDQVTDDVWRATWTDADERTRKKRFRTEREAIAHVAVHQTGGLRFHDLRHCYATWLVSAGVPVNMVQRVMGHAQPSTTLNRYTHVPSDYDDRVRAVFRDADEQPGRTEDDGEEGAAGALITA